MVELHSEKVHWYFNTKFYTLLETNCSIMTINSEILGRSKGSRSQHKLHMFHHASVMREHAHASSGRLGSGPSTTRFRTADIPRTS